MCFISYIIYANLGIIYAELVALQRAFTLLTYIIDNPDLVKDTMQYRHSSKSDFLSLESVRNTSSYLA